MLKLNGTKIYAKGVGREVTTKQLYFNNIVRKMYQNLFTHYFAVK